MRRLLALFLLLGVVAVGYVGWQAWQTRADLVDAEAAAQRLRDAVEARDRGGQDAALNDLQAAAASAVDGTDTWWWSLATHVPLVGDDARGVQALSSSVDTLASDGLAPLMTVQDDLDGVSVDGAVRVDVVRDVHARVQTAALALAAADAEVSELDSSGYVGPLRTRFEDYASQVGQVSRGVASAETATRLLPHLLGGDGPRRYLLVFQNNAEIRATGGLPGSWAVLNAVDGRLSLGKQGTGGEFGKRATPVLPLSDEERAVYSDLLGTFFLDAGFTPDFPRAAELMAARWEEQNDGTELDGVLSVDPVTLSYLLEGVGPVRVDDLDITSANAVEALLNRPYLELDPMAQDDYFARAAKAIFDATTRDIAEPVDFFEALARGASEDRVLFRSFDPAEQSELAGTAVEGALSDDDDDSTPHVDIGINDATGSKMSYYLRYVSDVAAESCTDGRQHLTGSLRLRQVIDPTEAEALPETVTGGGDRGIPAGTQLLIVRIVGPWGGSIGDVRLAGKRVEVEQLTLGGRPVVVVGPYLADTDELEVTWSMQTGAGQTGDVEVGVTPGIEPIDTDSVTASAC